MKEEPRHLHAPDAPPTMIHNPEEDETILARWLRHALEKGTTFWLLVVGVVVVVSGLTYLGTNYANQPSPAEESWMEMMVPGIPIEEKAGSKKYADEPPALQPLLTVIDEHPNTPAARWAMIHAAGYLYQEGLRDLPRNRDAAKPTLNRAYDYYEKAAEKAAKDSPERLMALMGMARTLETRGELEEARKEYQEVAEEFPDSPEAAKAKERAETLKNPEVVAFYDEFYKQDFSSRVSGPESSSPLIPGLPENHPPIGQPMFPNSGLLPGNMNALPGLGSEPTGPASEPAPLVPSEPMPALPSEPVPALPSEPFAPTTEEKAAPKAESSEPATEKAASPIPTDPFAPGGEEEPKR